MGSFRGAGFASSRAMAPCRAMLPFVLLSFLLAGCAWVRETSIRVQGGAGLLAGAEKALQEGRFGPAEESFGAFLRQHPGHSEAPRARLWLRALAQMRELKSLLETSARQGREEREMVRKVASLAEKGAYEEALGLLEKSPPPDAKPGEGDDPPGRKLLIALLREHLQTRAELARLERVRDELKALYLRLEKLRSPNR